MGFSAGLCPLNFLFSYLMFGLNVNWTEKELVNTWSNKSFATFSVTTLSEASNTPFIFSEFTVISSLQIPSRAYRYSKFIS